MNEVLELALNVAVIAIAAVLVVMILAIFFKWLPKSGPHEGSPFLQDAKGLLRTDAYYDVILNSGLRIPSIRFEGIVSRPEQAELPYVLNSFIAFSRADGRRVLLKLDTIRVLEESPYSEEA